MARQLIVVDVETTGLHDDAAALEVAAVNVDTGESMWFVPHVTCEQLGKAQPEALQINGYFERGVWRDMMTEKQTEKAYATLQDWLRGNTFGGSNPAFDSALIARQLVSSGYVIKQYVGKVWHHRLADLAAYAGGKFDVDPAELEGLDAVAERLGVRFDLGDTVDRHTAIGDARATATCFQILRETPAAAL